MKIEKCTFEKDKWGMYITPLIGYSNGPNERSVWIGWLRWLFKIHLSDR